LGVGDWRHNAVTITYFVSRKTNLIETKRGYLMQINKGGRPLDHLQRINREGSCKRKSNCKIVMDSAGGNAVGFGSACVAR